jgi:hypothetical protein
MPHKLRGAGAHSPTRFSERLRAAQLPRLEAFQTVACVVRYTNACHSTLHYVLPCFPLDYAADLPQAHPLLSNRTASMPLNCTPPSKSLTESSQAGRGCGKRGSLGGGGGGIGRGIGTAE